MPELFKLVSKEFSQKDNEWQWTYGCLFKFEFNKNVINCITITSYYQTKPGREMITNELILSMLHFKLNKEKREPRKKHHKRNIFVEEKISYQGKKYRLIFWFKDNTTNHLWVRNCHLQD